jgi:hypothetical protein
MSMSSVELCRKHHTPMKALPTDGSLYHYCSECDRDDHVRYEGNEVMQAIMDSDLIRQFEFE